MYIVVEGMNKIEVMRRVRALIEQFKISPVILNFPSDHCSGARAMRHTLEFSTILSDKQREDIIVREFKLLNEYAQTLISKENSVIVCGGPCSYMFAQKTPPEFTSIKKIMNMLPNDALIEKVLTPPIKIVGKSRLAKWLESDDNIQDWITRMTEFNTMY